jgi:hypothetical protein
MELAPMQRDKQALRIVAYLNQKQKHDIFPIVL